MLLAFLINFVDIASSSSLIPTISHSKHWLLWECGIEEPIRQLHPSKVCIFAIEIAISPLNTLNRPLFRLDRVARQNNISIIWLFSTVHNMDAVLGRVEYFSHMLLLERGHSQSCKCWTSDWTHVCIAWGEPVSECSSVHLLIRLLNFQDSDILNLGTGSISWFEVNGYGCIPTYPTNITSEDPYRLVRPEYVEGCFLEYSTIEVIHSAVQLFFAVS